MAHSDSNGPAPSGNPPRFCCALHCALSCNTPAIRLHHTAFRSYRTPDPDTAVEDVVREATLDINAPMYDVLGRQVDKTYRGIVIQNGQAFLIVK